MQPKSWILSYRQKGRSSTSSLCCSQPESTLNRDAYLSACSILRVAPEKGVGRASHRANHLRIEASEIAKFCVEDDNQCKRLMISYCIITKSYLFCTMELTV